MVWTPEFGPVENVKRKCQKRMRQLWHKIDRNSHLHCALCMDVSDVKCDDSPSLSITIRCWFFRCSEFVKTIRSVGSRGNEPLESVPLIVARAEWDGLDGQLPEEEEFSLDDLMNEDVESPKEDL